MLTNLHLSNFKSINMDLPIELAPYSIFCGANSSGKSSLVQAVLMLAQTFGGRLQEDSIVLNGNLARLGSLYDIRKYGAKGNVRIMFSLEVKDKFFKHDYRLRCELEFGSAPGKKLKTEDEYHPPINSVKCEVLRTGADEDEGEELRDFIHVVSAEAGKAGVDKNYIVESFDISKDGRLNKEFPKYRVVECKRNSIVPSEFVIEYDYTQKVSQYVIGAIVGDRFFIPRLKEQGIDELELRLPNCFFLTLRELISSEKNYLKSSVEIPKEIMAILEDKLHVINIDDVKRHMVDASFPLDPEMIAPRFFEEAYTPVAEWRAYFSGLDEKSRKALSNLIDKYRIDLQESWYSGTEVEVRTEVYRSPVFNNVNALLSRYFSSSVKYLGPLRAEPQAVYNSIGYADPNSVGLKGEYTAAVLHYNRDRKINYYSPISDGSEFSYKSKTSSLKEACQDWLSYLGVVESFTTSDRGKLGYELRVKTAEGEDWQDLTHVGVGVSQVLPIILMFLLSSEGDVLVFEQPELHLHPKIQTRLCDLFLVMSGTGRQCLVETHSEYMINRLRLRIAQSEDTDIMLNSAIYFVNKARDGSGFDRVKINRFGAIKEWPVDFFDQTDREVERILIEAAKKAKKERVSHARND